MTIRAKRLERLLAIRRLSEELGRRTLALALRDVTEVEDALAQQMTAQAESRVAARQALVKGDRSGWLMADAQGEVAGWNRGRLRVLLEERAAKVEAAMEKFMESRREHEQVKQVVEAALESARAEDGRKAQAAADDWFLSRRRNEPE